MNGSETLERNPAEIEAEIVRTRASLHEKLHELERRLNPKARVRDVRRRLNPEPYIGWVAVVAIAAGMMMCVAGWRRYRTVPAGTLDDPATAEMMGE
jgi:hypothetical protein